MENIQFDAVTVETRKIGTYQVITSVREAVDALMYNWPVEDTPILNAAKQVCLDALGGKTTGDHARAAFVRAALEAAILIKG